MHLKTNLEEIANEEIRLEAENRAFMQHLNAYENAALLDSKVNSLNAAIAPKISCTDCGNCCKTLMINITEPECNRISKHLNVTTSEFKALHVETSASGEIMVMNKMPCTFLKDKACSIYENRFTECKAFPQLDVPNFRNRTFSTMMHFGRCPIIYNVIQGLKMELGFENKK